MLEDTNLGEKIPEFLKQVKPDAGRKVKPLFGPTVKPVFGPKMKPRCVSLFVSFGPKTGFTFEPTLKPESLLGQKVSEKFLLDEAHASEFPRSHGLHVPFKSF